MSANILRRTTTGDVTTAAAYLRAVVLTPAAAASSVVIRAGGSGGTVILTLNAVANGTSVVMDMHGVYCAGGIHATLSGASAEASVIYQ